MQNFEWPANKINNNVSKAMQNQRGLNLPRAKKIWSNNLERKPLDLYIQLKSCMERKKSTKWKWQNKEVIKSEWKGEVIRDLLYTVFLNKN